MYFKSFTVVGIHPYRSQYEILNTIRTVITHERKYEKSSYNLFAELPRHQAQDRTAPLRAGAPCQSVSGRNDRGHELHQGGWRGPSLRQRIQQDTLHRHELPECGG